MRLSPATPASLPAAAQSGERSDPAAGWKTPGGISVSVRTPPCPPDGGTASPLSLRLHLEHARLSLLRGFDELLCLEGLRGVEHLPHQIETVRKVLRHFRGRVLLADEVGLGKTIEACLLLREYLLRGLVRRVLILVPTPLVSQWSEELVGKFGLDFSIPPRSSISDRADYWTSTDRVLTSLAFAKSRKRSALVAAAAWDLVIVDEAHHCKNRATRNWQLINSLSRRHMFLLTATPVQNNLLELYNLLTLLEPGHLRTEADFKRQYVRRGNPRDPRNRERLRSLLGEVMVRNTRSLVQIELPPRYAQTIVARPDPEEARLYDLLEQYLRQPGQTASEKAKADDGESDIAAATDGDRTLPGEPTGDWQARDPLPPEAGPAGAAQLTRMQLAAILAAQGSHPAAVVHSLRSAAARDPQAAELVRLAGSIASSAKDQRLLELVRDSAGHKLLVFVNFRRTLGQLDRLLTDAGVPHSIFSGDQSDREKDAAVEAFRERVPVMLSTDSGGEGRNLQFADTLVNYDLPWNPMRIEQRVGRVHRIGQT
ncbi:MAG: SNF2-related protein, partial [Pirellulales bacterium]